MWVDPTPHLDQHIVPQGMSEGVIHFFEPVEIDQQDRHPVRGGESLLETTVEHVPVWKPCERVSGRKKDGPVDLATPIPLEDPEQQHRNEQQQRP